MTRAVQERKEKGNEKQKKKGIVSPKGKEANQII